MSVVLLCHFIPPSNKYKSYSRSPEEESYKKENIRREVHNLVTPNDRRGTGDPLKTHCFPACLDVYDSWAVTVTLVRPFHWCRPNRLPFPAVITVKELDACVRKGGAYKKRCSSEEREVGGRCSVNEFCCCVPINGLYCLMYLPKPFFTRMSCWKMSTNTLWESILKISLIHLRLQQVYRLRIRLLTTYSQSLTTCNGTQPVVPSQCTSISVEVYLVRAPES